MWLPGRWFTIKISSNLMCPIESWDLKIGGEIPEACCYTDIRLNGLHYHIINDMYQTWTLPQNLNEANFWFKKAIPQKNIPEILPPKHICSPNIIITVCGRICFQKKHPLEIQRFQGLNILIFVAAGLECHLWQMPGISKLFRRRVVLPGNSLMGCDESGVVAMALFFFFWGGGGGRNSSGKRTT